MQTEPIGFKGTPGEWYFEDHNPETSRYFGNIISDLGIGDNGIKNIRTMTIQFSYAAEEENAANTKLMVASKEMAVALQEIQRKVLGQKSLNWTDILFINGTCVEALQQAGNLNL